MRLGSVKKACCDEGSRDQYLREISRYPLISREDEVFLAQRIRTGCHEALDKLVRGNLPFVVSGAKKNENLGGAAAPRDGAVGPRLRWPAGPCAVRHGRRGVGATGTVDLRRARPGRHGP